MDILKSKYDIAKDLQEANRYLNTNKYHIIFSDIYLGFENPFDFIKSLNNKSKIIKV